MAKVAVTCININITIITMYTPEDQGVTLKRIFMKVRPPEKIRLSVLPILNVYVKLIHVRPTFLGYLQNKMCVF